MPQNEQHIQQYSTKYVDMLKPIYDIFLTGDGSQPLSLSHHGSTKFWMHASAVRKDDQKQMMSVSEFSGW